MKKTLTVNLGGTVFHIDEDAYQLLDNYLSNLRIHFMKEEGSGEIMDDFEMRISELLNERIRLGYEVITIEHIEEVIKRMGKPEEIFEEEEEPQQHKEATHRAAEPKQTVKKRLMRDPDNRILGGVAGGLAAYMDCDPTAIRIAMIMLLLFYGSVIPFYLLLWIIMPLAQTATEKLLMRGKNVTVENIGKTVTDGFEKVSNNVNDYINSEKPRTLLQKLADAFVQIIGFALKFIAILIGIVTLPFLLLIVFVLFITAAAMIGGLIAGSTELLYNLSPFGMTLSTGAPIGLVIMGCIGTLLLIGIPVFSLAYTICNQLFHLKPMATSAKWTLLVLWIIALIVSSIYFYQSSINGWLPFSWMQQIVNYQPTLYIM